MRTTKIQAAQAMYELLSALHGCFDNGLSRYDDRTIDAMVAVRAVAQEFQGGDPRGRKGKVEKAPSARLVGGEQELFRA